RHPQVLEAPAVRVAAELHPEIAHPDLATEPLRPEEVRAALVERDHAIVGHVGTDPLLLPPHARPVRPDGALVALIEERLPRFRRPFGERRPQRVHVVDDVEQAVALRTAVDGRGDGVITGAPREAAEDGPRHMDALSPLLRPLLPSDGMRPAPPWCRTPCTR